MHIQVHLFQVAQKRELERTKEALAAAKSDLLRDESIFAEKVAEMKRFQDEVADVHNDREKMRLRLIELEEQNGALTAKERADNKLAADMASKQQQLMSLQAELQFVKRSNERFEARAAANSSKLVVLDERLNTVTNVMNVMILTNAPYK